MSKTIKKSFNSLAIIMIFCQLFFVGSFLFYPAKILAEEETTSPDPVVVETPAETPVIVVETPTETSTEPTTVETPAETPAEEPAEPSAGGPASTEPRSGGPATTSLSPDNNTTPSPAPAPLVCTDETPVFVLGGESSAPVNEPINLQMQSTPLVGPRVLAFWAMTNEKNEAGQYLAADNDAGAGAQFLPSGQFAVDKSLMVCALVADDLNESTVTAKLSYPAEAAPKDQTACGQPLADLTLTALSDPDARALFCSQLKNNNNNLPTFASGLSFDALCAPSGDLFTATAHVYCAEKNLGFADPAGDYQAVVTATDTLGRVSPDFPATFKYLELTAYAVDFDNISYGPVQPLTPKVITGDTIWNSPLGPNPATVSNVGNTRLQLVVKQNDFGLGKTGDHWNISYSARIGPSDFVDYFPNTPTPLAKIMELAETNSLDFGIHVFAFPTDTTAAYAGEMFLSAVKVESLPCQ